MQPNGGDGIETWAEGCWHMGGSEGGGPDGIRWASANESDVVCPSAKIGTLIASLGGAWVGSPHAALGSHGRATLHPSESGQLNLLFNDRAKCCSDNCGCVSVTLVVARAKGEQKSIQVVSPNGEDNWPIGSQQKTMRGMTGSIPCVDICVSRDGGQCWKIVDENIPNTSAVYESVAATVGSPASDNCLIGVGDSSPIFRGRSPGIGFISVRRASERTSDHGFLLQLRRQCDARRVRPSALRHAPPTRGSNADRQQTLTFGPRLEGAGSC